MRRRMRRRMCRRIHVLFQGCLLLEDHLVEAVDLARGAKARGSALHTHIRERERERERESVCESARESAREGERGRERASERQRDREREMHTHSNAPTPGMS